jgi:hypothetical protein
MKLKKEEKSKEKKIIATLNENGEVVIKVTFTELVAYKEGMNGWTPEEFMDYWFGERLHSSSLEPYKVGSSKRIKKTKVFLPKNKADKTNVLSSGKYTFTK